MAHVSGGIDGDGAQHLRNKPVGVVYGKCKRRIVHDSSSSEKPEGGGRARGAVWERDVALGSYTLATI